VLEGLSQERLRHVFLHELAHLKRHDIAFNWLAAVAQALHWFNPLVWLALREARTDMEMACDELAIARLSEQESGEYGHTVLDLVTVWPPPKRTPMVAAIGEDGTGIKRRIQMIAAFKKRQRVSYLLPAVTLLLLAAVFLVDAREGSPQPQAGVPRTASEKAPPVDAAMKSASGWLALLDAGDCGSTWTETHSVARGMLSRETWTGMCTALRRLDSAERGKVISRNPVGVQYIPNLPLGLGDGVSVTFRTKYEKGEYPGPKLLLAADKDGVWRLVRSDRE
jgi:hypothetical protein